MKINVTGATGNLGQKIIKELLKRKTDEQIGVTVRNEKKARKIFGDSVDVSIADYQSPDRLLAAFTGTDTLVYIPSIVHPNLKRIAEFENVLSALEKAKVNQLIVVGFLADHENNPFVLSPFYGYVPRRLASAEINYTIIRNAMYADPLPPYIPELIEMGRLPYPAGDGKINFVSREDLARTIAEIAIRPALYGKTYTLTGKKAYSMPELAEILSEASGHTIVYDPMTAREFADTYDEPKGFGKILASLYVAASRHLMDETTNHIESITGQEPEDLLSFIKRNYKG